MNDIISLNNLDVGKVKKNTREKNSFLILLFIKYNILFYN